MASSSESEKVVHRKLAGWTLPSRLHHRPKWQTWDVEPKTLALWTRTKRRSRRYAHRVLWGSRPDDMLAPVREFMPPVIKKRNHRPQLGLDWRREEDAPALEQLRKHVEQQERYCICELCDRMRRSDHPTRFRCLVFRCKSLVPFDDLLSLVDHQLAEHGRVRMECRRVLSLLGRQEHGKVPMPPVTVYVVAQYFAPSVRPTRWTAVECVENERAAHADRVGRLNPVDRTRQYLEDAFDAAAARVMHGGLPELERQFQIALEFYNSALTYPSGNNRVCHDGSISVGPGRNWLVR